MSKDVDVLPEMAQAEFFENVSLVLLGRTTVLMARYQIPSVFRADERIVIEEFTGRGPLRLNIVSDLQRNNGSQSPGIPRACVHLFEFALVGIEPKNGDRLHQIAEEHEIVLHLHLQTIDVPEVLRQLDEFVI